MHHQLATDTHQQNLPPAEMRMLTCVLMLLMLAPAAAVAQGVDSRSTDGSRRHSWQSGVDSRSTDGSSSSNQSSNSSVGVQLAKPCSPSCTTRGNCNIEEGRCECPFGLTGPACEIGLLSGCQSGPDAPAFPGIYYPKNCRCYRQVYEFFNCSMPGGGCRAMIYNIRGDSLRCYEFDGKPEEEQWSIMPSAATAGVTWHKAALDSDGMKLTAKVPQQEGSLAVDWWDRRTPALPQSDCPQNCSFQGVCVGGTRRPPECVCEKGYQGDTCRIPMLQLCPNACNGRGHCMRGFCHCEPPWFGADCSRSKAYASNPAALPQRHRLKVYMYELPSQVAFPISLDDDLFDLEPIYQAEAQFQAIFLSSWAIRTENPYEANLFYIPAHVYAYVSNVNPPGNQLRYVIQYVNTTYPFFARHEGRDHFVWLPGDKGSCHTPQEGRHMIKIVHFGLHLNQRVKQTFLKPPPDDKDDGCVNPERDVVAAPYNEVGYEEAGNEYAAITAANGKDPKRTNLFFFAGGVRRDEPNYSGGVRQALHSMLKARKSEPGMEDVVFVDGAIPDYRRLLSTSKFCLAPHGAGFGIRLSIAMVHACIPVIIQNQVYQPFEDVLPYHEFSLRLSKSDIPQLLSILRSISDDEQDELRRGMAKHYRAFIWEPAHGGTAFNYTIESLHRRVSNLWADMYRRHRRRSLRGQMSSIQLVHAR